MLGSVPGRLAVMMFLQYCGLAAVAIPLTRYLQTPAAAGGLGFRPAHVGYVYMTFSVGAMVTPLVAGLLADRWFAVERVIAAAHAGMAAALAAAAAWCGAHGGPAAGPDVAVWPLVVLVLGYAVGSQLTLTLAAVISFRNLPHWGTFWYVRLVGTAGWVAAGFMTGWALDPISPQPLYLAAGASAALAVFAAVALPHTPPKGHGRPVREVLGLPALTMFRDRSFVVFALALVVCNGLGQFYALFASPYLKELGVEVDLGRYGRLAPEVVMALAQVCEVGCMAATPWLLRRLELRHLLLLGLGGLVLRNLLLYLANVPAVVAVALPMHGWGYAFYGLLGSYFVDREAPPHLRAGAQSLLTFLASGPAVLTGNLLASRVVEANRVGAATDWAAVWAVPLAGCAAALAAFAVLFREPPEPGAGHAAGRSASAPGSGGRE